MKLFDAGLFSRPSRLIVLLLGLFEFFALYELWTTNISDTNLLIPKDFFDDIRVKFLYSAYILTLGIQRITWSSIEINLLSWACFVLTHVVESLLWWSLAIAKYASTDVGRKSFKTTPSHEIVFSILTSNGQLAKILLIGVPLLTIILAIIPILEVQNGRTKKSNKKTE